MELQERRQWAFDISARHLLKQGKPSFQDNDPDQCSYLGSGCAVMPFVPHGEIEGWEHFGGVTDVVAVADKAASINPPDYIVQDVRFFGDLQTCHDAACRSANGQTAEWRVDWLKRMRDTAFHYRLDASVLEEGFADA